MSDERLGVLEEENEQLRAELAEKNKTLSICLMKLYGSGTSVTNFAPRLIQFCRECSEPGWDGYGAKPITGATCDRALALIRELPDDLGAPDVIPESDGEIALEWFLSPSRSLSISIGESGPIHYAGLLGPHREIHGAAPFIDTVPPDVHDAITKVLRQELIK